MGLLARTLGLALSTSFGVAGCYAPDIRDCTVRCTTEDDCAGGQVCGTSGFCVAEAQTACMATGSISGTSVDGGVMVQIDAGAPPPDAPPDAPTHGLITVTLAGKGYVELDGVGTCDTDPPQSGTCSFTLPLALTVTMRAVADEDWEFERWTTSACPVQDDPTCTFVPLLTMQLSAKFRKD